MTDHKTIPLTPPQNCCWWATGHPIDIDEELAPVIALLWERGIETMQCCQHSDWSDSAEISFGTFEDMQHFINLVLPNPGRHPERDTLSSRMRDWEIYVASPSRARDGWKFIIAPEWNTDEWGFVAEVQFPVSDIPEVLKRLQEKKTNELVASSSS